MHWQGMTGQSDSVQAKSNTIPGAADADDRLRTFGGLAASRRRHRDHGSHGRRLGGVHCGQMKRARQQGAAPLSFPETPRLMGRHVASRSLMRGEFQRVSAHKLNGPGATGSTTPNNECAHEGSHDPFDQGLRALGGRKAPARGQTRPISSSLSPTAAAVQRRVHRWRPGRASQPTPRRSRPAHGGW